MFCREFLFWGMTKRSDILNNVAEHIANDWPEQEQDRNNDDSHQDQNQSVFYQALTFFIGKE
jgi:hypothetical protein